MSSSGSPVFSREDRVGDAGGGDALPAELAGKSPAEIARYYQQREHTLRTEMEARMAAAAPPPAVVPAVVPAAEPSNTEFWNNPSESTKRIVAAQGVSRTEWEQIKNSSGQSLIWAAQQIVKERHPDFERVRAEIDAIMKMTPDWQKTDPNHWETAYLYSKGKAHERLNLEDKAAAVASSTSERVNPGSTAPPPMDDLNKVTGVGLKAHQTAAHVADELGVTHDAYRKSAKELEGDGLLNFTYDNRRKK